MPRDGACRIVRIRPRMTEGKGKGGKNEGAKVERLCPRQVTIKDDE
jgi:hypothetical protein